ncbi:S16 family serine protease [Pseudarthrobacter sp. PS3-L1]|uniref:YlbL family protein n=1 Tax=Pseudarthrobacter sp. PS3-L1 TaxID=3046207 RepID=UPI0024B9C405|nr:S16 family serine protease [Pseudarthrobacter sp. PS3-L1]MDJ0321455.1 PDZ domain-containing protein [Pseudarthrobacter sp. PS3-L1]
MTTMRGDQPTGQPVSQASDGSDEPWEARKNARDGRFSTLVFAGVLAAALGVTAVTLPVPYVVEAPGPTFNTLGEYSDKPVISVSGTEAFPTTGNLDLTTVYVDGGPNGPVSFIAALGAWLDNTKAVYPQELIYPDPVTSEESQAESAAAMVTSQENAVAAALSELGIDYSQQLQAAGLPEGSPSAGKLEPNDVFVSIDGKPITALSVVQDELAAKAGAEVSLVVDRDGVPTTVAITPTKNDAGRYLLGVSLQYLFTFPFDVSISLDKVGGPSAGMMFALGIIDTVTPGDLTGGKHIAGTGTISPDGAVGPIGGIAQKMHGARNGGATLFLAPAANCDETLGHVPDGLQVVRVENLADARSAVELAASGADTENLPACTSN